MFPLTMFRLHSSAAPVRVRHYFCLSSLVYEGTVAYCEGGRPHKVLINIIETLLFHVLNLTTLLLLFLLLRVKTLPIYTLNFTLGLRIS